MKSSFQKMALVCMALFVNGCADVRGPQWLTGEPPAHELVRTRPFVGADKERADTWPRLADVPDERPAFSSPLEREQRTKELLSARLQSDAEKERIQNLDLYGTHEQPMQEAEAPFSYSALKP